MKGKAERPRGFSSSLIPSMKCADAFCVAGRRDAEEFVAACGEPAIEEAAQRCERPDGEQGSDEAPAWQHAHHFEPGIVSGRPASRGDAARVHLRIKLMESVRRATLNFRVTIIEPFDSMKAVARFNLRAHPLTQRTLPVRVNFKLRCLAHTTINAGASSPVAIFFG